MAEVQVASATPWRVHRGPSRWTVGVVLAVVVVSVVVWTAHRPSDTRLYEWGWELESATIEGSPVEITTNGDRQRIRTTIDGRTVETIQNPVRWRFSRVCASGVGSAPGCRGQSSLTVSGGCGSTSTRVLYSDTSVSWTGDARRIGPACVGELSTAVIAVGGSGSFDFEFGGDRLVVSAPDDAAELVFRPDGRVGWGD